MNFHWRRSSILALYSQLVQMQRAVPAERVRPQSVLADPEAGLRIQLLRAGAAWLIGWASLMVLLSWVR
ncbi:MAG: hypothetical protein ACRDKG_00460 [Actinomycetota bacterium]